MKIKDLTAIVYDIEAFPNVFTVAAKNTESKNKICYEVSERKNDLPQIAKLFLHKKIIMVGYNNHHYDDLVINYILLNYHQLISLPVWSITKAIKDFSDSIINSQDKQLKSFYKYKYARLFPSVDLLTMMFSSKLRVGLKAMQVTMEFPNVREYEGDFGSHLPISEIDNMISYNFNDVESTEELLYRNLDKINIRLAMNERYGIDVLSTDDVNMGMEILKSQYMKKSGIDWRELKDLRSPCDQLCLNDIIFDFIKFESPQLVALLKDLKSQCIDPSDNSFERVFELGGTVYTYGLGGIHSQQEPEKFEPKNGEYKLIDVDVASMYPTIILEHKVYPEHLGIQFLETYHDIYVERLEAKHNGNKPVNEGLKKCLNGLTGNLQSEYSWVYSPKAALTIRINGQLMLLMLAEKFAKAGIKVINANTDGLFVKCPTDKLDEMKKLCSEWEEITKMKLEADYFERFYQYAINDYIGVKEGWSETHDPKLIKTKGLFLTSIELGKGLPPMIIAEALKNYFVEGIPVDKTLKDCTDIKKFLTFQKVNKEFAVEYMNERIAHINRYYMSTNGSYLQKCRVDEKGKGYDYQSICASSGVTIFNVLTDIDPKLAKINYGWYRNEIYKIILPIETEQPTLF